VKPGAQLRLLFNVSKLNGEMCAPLPGAQVDVWHCDALGVYSDVENQVGKKFLRGYQITDETGTAEFIKKRRKTPAFKRGIYRAVAKSQEQS